MSLPDVHLGDTVQWTDSKVTRKGFVVRIYKFGRTNFVDVMVNKTAHTVRRRDIKIIARAKNGD